MRHVQTRASDPSRAPCLRIDAREIFSNVRRPHRSGFQVDENKNHGVVAASHNLVVLKPERFCCKRQTQLQSFHGNHTPPTGFIRVLQDKRLLSRQLCCRSRSLL
ncbi:hypothetical protein PINS_up006643 [Pythium insidiosum]|nr:hypothetical protein PINS_up006643 [Pythium insidiosum]